MNPGIRWFKTCASCGVELEFNSRTDGGPHNSPIRCDKCDAVVDKAFRMAEVSGPYIPGHEAYYVSRVIMNVDEPYELL